ncbi:MAG: inorganic diphosphatase [Pedobacter sp.]|nr:inorganic diphosphatase [Pedobacter sp.]
MHRQTFYRFSIIVLFLFQMSCGGKKDYKSIPTFDANGKLNAVIEIPAGTNKKIEFDPDTKQFKTDQRDGRDRIIPFLPYPGNYGFVPSTLSDSQKGGDGDPVDIIVICETQPSGTVMPVIPITMLKLIDNDEEDFKVIAVPADQKLNALGITTLEELRAKKPAVLEIIEKWFLSYDTEPASSLGWASQKETLEYIRSNAKKP